MAARLVQRCCRRLFGGSTFASLANPASLLAPASKTVIARALPQGALASLYTSGLSRQIDTHSVKKQGYSGHPENRKIDELIASAPSPGDLLHVGEHDSLNGKQASALIIQLSQLVVKENLKPESILQDSRFQRVLGVLHSQISQVCSSSLLPLLKSLDLLGLERNKRELRSVKQEVRWRLRRLDFRQIASLAEYVAASKQAEDQNELLSDIVKHLELRWTEIGDTRAVVVMMVKLGHLSKTLMDRLEDKALELAEQFTAEDIRKLTLALAIQKRRSVPLLRAISYHLVQKHFTLSTSVLVDLAFAYGKLNFHDTQVFQKMSSDLHARVFEMTPGNVGRCIKSFAYLKWLSLPLFEAFTQYTLDNADRFNTLKLCDIILSFARLNFQPSRSENFYNMIHEKLGDQLGSLNPHLLTDLVWSLCVLQQAKTPYLQSVLAPQFYRQLLDDQTPRGQNYRLKLMHINAAARLESPGYEGPFLPPEALSAPEPPEDRKATPLQSSLQEVLNKVAKSEVNRRFNVHTIYGWQLDAEMMLNSDSQPLPIKDFASPHLLQSEGTKPPPHNTMRIAFLGWEFPNFSSRSKELLGRFAMARRHVQAAGFLIVDSAQRAKASLNGADIYSGCCTLKIEYAKPTRLNVFKNDQDTWDYTNPNLSGQGDPGGNPNKRQRQPPLLGDHPAEYGGPHGGYHSHYHDEGYGPPPPHYEGRRMGPPVGGHRRGPSRYGPQYGHPPPPPPPPEYGPHADSPVLMVYGLDQSKMNCDRVFNVFCLYGNVEKVKFMKSKPGAAMVEMADGYAVDRAITHLNNNFMFGQKLNVCVSKQQAIMPGQSYGLEDGSCSYKDFSGSRNNRFSTPEQAAKNRIQHPSNVLHFFNAPLEVTEDNFYEICDELGAKRPASVKVFSGKMFRPGERSSSGLLEWDSKSDALETLSFLNHYQMKNPNGPYPYTLKLCFSTAQHAS